MHILIAPDSFKETLSAAQAAEAIARGVHRAMPDAGVDLCPMADGGEGTVDALVKATTGEFRATTVSGPLGKPVTATWGVLGQAAGLKPQAVLEMAEAAGLHLVPIDRRDPTRTTTYGVGELIRAALDEGCRRILIGIGGSATTDGGAGMAQALGVGFSQSDGSPCVCGLAGGGLPTISRIDLSTRDPRLAETDITVACDVTNPLCGPNGAAAVYGPQKGATPEQVPQLDNGLCHLADLMRIDSQQPGFGAAGGLGFGLVAFAGATLQRGIELVMDAVDFDRRAAHADLILTGEGKLDGQSIQGKTCIGVAQRAARFGKPVIALVGKADDDARVCLNHGLTAYHAIVSDQITPQQAMSNAARYLEQLAAEVLRDYCPSTG